MEMNRSPTNIALVQETLSFFANGAVRRCRAVCGDGRSTFITQRPRDLRSRLFLYVVRRSSLFTVSGLSCLDLFPWRFVNDLAFSSRFCSEKRWFLDPDCRRVRLIEQCTLSLKRLFRIFSLKVEPHLNIFFYSSSALSVALNLSLLHFRIFFSTLSEFFSVISC